MGPKPSSEQKKQQSIQKLTINHPRFDRAKFLTSKTGEYLQISVPVLSEQEVKNWGNNYKPYSSYDCLLLPLSYEFKGTQMCGSNGFCQINYDNFPYLLEGEITDRMQGQKKWFENGQLWYLAYTILEAANIFHTKGKKIGDVRPCNIFINDNGQTKIANHLSWPQEYTNYQKTVFDKQVTYLAPEQIKDEHFGHTESRANFEIAEAFSVGLTLLDSVLLINSKDLYNLANHRFEYQKLQSRMNQLFSYPHIDQHLKLVIAGLCRLNPPDRLKCKQLFEWLNKYRSKIIQIEPFQFQEYPSFLQFAPQQRSILSQNLPVAKPSLYIESQVVAHTPQAVFVSEPIQFVNTIQPVPLPRPPVQIMRQPIQSQQIHYDQYNPLVVLPTQIPTIQERQVGSYVVNGTVSPASTAKAASSNDDFKLTLSKIEEQLALSRKMFPS